MKPKILLVNPPIYDFTAYDFWLKPYGMLNAAGKLRNSSHLFLFDYLDRIHPKVKEKFTPKFDKWGRGSFYAEQIGKPDVFACIPRIFRRFGAKSAHFCEFLEKNGPFHFVLIQTSMTYWYPGVREVIETVRRHLPRVTVVLGGIYATLCTKHAQSLGADLVIPGANLDTLYNLTGIKPDTYQPPYWEGYQHLDTGVMKLTKGCPYHCTYCAGDRIDGQFAARPLDECIEDLQLLLRKGVSNIAFYDDALLCQPESALIPFLEYVLKNDVKVNFHTPNALHARFITPDIAKLMVRAGFKTFYLGFESKSADFHAKTGAKVISDELAAAAESLLNAGADKKNICTYQILGHPQSSLQQLEDSMRFAHSLGLKTMLADFSPIPETPDGEYCRKFVDLDEPLNHNKTAFPIIFLGEEKVNHFKALNKRLNNDISP